MTVAELIEKLREMPQDAEAWFISPGGVLDTVLLVDHEPEMKLWSGAEPVNAVVLR